MSYKHSERVQDTIEAITVGLKELGMEHGVDRVDESDIETFIWVPDLGVSIYLVSEYNSATSFLSAPPLASYTVYSDASFGNKEEDPENGNVVMHEQYRSMVPAVTKLIGRAVEFRISDSIESYFYARDMNT